MDAATNAIVIWFSLIILCVVCAFGVMWLLPKTGLGISQAVAGFLAWTRGDFLAILQIPLQNKYQKFGDITVHSKIH